MHVLFDKIPHASKLFLSIDDARCVRSRIRAVKKTSTTVRSRCRHFFYCCTIVTDILCTDDCYAMQVATSPALSLVTAADPF